MVARPEGGRVLSEGSVTPRVISPRSHDGYGGYGGDPGRLSADDSTHCNPSEMQVALGRALAWSSRHGEAVEALEAAVRLKPTDGVAYGLLAEQLIATSGERTQTRGLVRQATPPAHHEGLANLESRLESVLAATARLAPARLPYLPAWLPKELGRAAGFEFEGFGGAAGAVPAQPEDMASAWHSFSRSRMELPAMRKRLQRRRSMVCGRGGTCRFGVCSSECKWQWCDGGCRRSVSIRARVQVR
jgi:hypothetical protein